MLCVIRHVGYLHCRVFGKADCIMRIFRELRDSGFRFLRSPALACLVVSVGCRCLCNLGFRQRSHASLFLRRIMAILIQRHILLFLQVHASIHRTVGYFNLVLIRDLVSVVVHSEVRYVFGCYIHASYLLDILWLQLCIPAYHLSVLRPVLEGVSFFRGCHGAAWCSAYRLHHIRAVRCASMLYVIRHISYFHCRIFDKPSF